MRKRDRRSTHSKKNYRNEARDSLEIGVKNVWLEFSGQWSRKNAFHCQDNDTESICSESFDSKLKWLRLGSHDDRRE